MHQIDLVEGFLRRMDDRVRKLEVACGCGIESSAIYWQKVGEIRGYKRAKEDLIEMLRKSEKEENDD